VAVLRVSRGKHTYLWEPLSAHCAGAYTVVRNLYKNVYGNKLIFEEINDDLGLTYRYSWRTGERFGFVLTMQLENHAGDSYTVDALCGLQNLLPYGVTIFSQSMMSNLLDAYKRNELETQTGLGTFALSASLTDLAEPSESLKATVAWQVGLEGPCHLLSSRQVDQFRGGVPLTPETDVRGFQGAYMANAAFKLAQKKLKAWSVVADVNYDHAAIAALVNTLKQKSGALQAELEQDIDATSADLVSIIASADGLQTTRDRLCTAHHFSNVLFNTMRGGIFATNYQVGKADLIDFVQVRNRPVCREQEAFFADLPDELDYRQLLTRAAATGSADLERLCSEYLPLMFSRRHGDPSRPWNRFSIDLKNPDGSRKLGYQGNWRDIFQNWEPLLWSYPRFAEGMVAKFLNATTFDGYNPYRLTREGIEWEIPSPGDPWANIGYWSDHQIIYLQKLLEGSSKFQPGRLLGLLGKKVFSCANIPYRIKPLAEIQQDWHETILFDQAAHDRIEELVQDMGTDGKMVLDAQAHVFHVNLAEKLLCLLLAKLANLVPEGGIWMNTQRPEWNDANNALAGKGLSVVTLGYLRRYTAFFRDLVASSEEESIELTRELGQFFEKMYQVLEEHQDTLETSFSDSQRRQVMDALGQAGSDYRWHYYEHGPSGEFAPLDQERLLAFLDLTLRYVEHSLRANRRSDALYHAYNVLRLEPNEAQVVHLYEMLEGQVAILSSGMLSSQEALGLLRGLRESRMYRADQHSYMLYPERELPGFLEKNRFTQEQVAGSALIARLVEDGDHSLIERDVNGIYHFHGSFRNAKDVARVLSELRENPAYASLVDDEAEALTTMFEEAFDHQSFTGRSGTFFAYEGVGSIYWHMVSKLLLAAQEVFVQAVEQGGPEEMIQALADVYYDVRQGLGYNKSPKVYGAFPTDPYSHTPAGRGAKQPGMTGQVKEEILTRLVELGVLVEQGVISFRPVLLRTDEFLDADTAFEIVDVAGQDQTIDLPAGSLAFTLCQVPVIYRAGQENRIEVHQATGGVMKVTSDTLDAETSRHIFDRDGHVLKVVVHTHAAW